MEGKARDGVGGTGTGIANSGILNAGDGEDTLIVLTSLPDRLQQQLVVLPMPFMDKE
ncbi:MAG: hypothetical protein V7K40_25225 [Nostoc sp.]|uniref:hypothetical protein n=1 Tax=Nostoc sp. TaxID=1180 RepID=UPI002FF66B3D